MDQQLITNQSKKYLSINSEIKHFLILKKNWNALIPSIGQSQCFSFVYLHFSHSLKRFIKNYTYLPVYVLNNFDVFLN